MTGGVPSFLTLAVVLRVVLLVPSLTVAEHVWLTPVVSLLTVKSPQPTMFDNELPAFGVIEKWTLTAVLYQPAQLPGAGEQL